MAITLVMVRTSLIFRNFMPDREEDPKPGAWDGKGRMSRRTYTVLRRTSENPNVLGDETSSRSLGQNNRCRPSGKRTSTAT